MLYELAEGLYGSADHPFPAFRVRDRGLLESAIALPHQPYYETFFDKLAAMVRSIAANHGLHDGNKRLAVTVLHATLLVNGYFYLWSDDDTVAIAERCASGDTDFRWLAAFIEVWSSRGNSRSDLDQDELRERIGRLRLARQELLDDHRSSFGQ